MKLGVFSSLLSVALLSFGLLCTGCSSPSSVRLVYQSAGASFVPSINAPSVVVVSLADKRGRSDLGVDSQGKALSAASNVSDWMTRALADKLIREGFRVSVAPSVKAAKAGKQQCIVEGTIEKLWLQGKDRNTYEAQIRLQLRVRKGDGKPNIRNISGAQEKSGIPGARLVEETLTGALNEVMNSAVASIVPIIK